MHHRSLCSALAGALLALADGAVFHRLARRRRG